MVKSYSRSHVDYKPNDDYYTPPEVFQILGLTFDLDVCAPVGGVPWIPAARHYSLADDGLSQSWQGRVWMNPPYSKPGPWILRFVEHGHGVCLTQISKSAGLRNLWQKVDGVVLPQDRLLAQSRFIYADQIKAVFMPVALFAFGAECVEAIARFGRVR